MQDFAQTFEGSDCAAIVTAAQSFRNPYWDWVVPQPIGQDTLPSSLSSPANVEVTTPSATKTIPNPLYQYHLNQLSDTQLPDYPVNLPAILLRIGLSADIQQYSIWPDTLRFPASNHLKASSQTTAINVQLDKNQASYSKRYSNLLQAYPTYDRVSNKA